MKPDLHMHTTSSDGTLSPEELVSHAAACGVTLMAITDHDSLDGVAQMSGRQTAIPVLPGTELSLRDMKGLHLLGYGVTENTEMHRVVRELAAKRLTRAKRMVEKLTELGMPLDYEAICASCQGSVGRPHIARAMVERGYVGSLKEAFSRWIGNDGPAYVAGERLSMSEALPLMRRSGFVPVLAHPAELEKDDVTLCTLLEAWRAQGLMGVEVYHPSQKHRGYAKLDAMARRMDFLVTGGSDFHSEGDGRHGSPGSTASVWRSAEEDVNRLLRAMNDAAGMTA